jgi:integrase
LRWRYQKQRYSFNLFHYSKTHLLQAKKIALTIESDMVNEAFDCTLNKYKPACQLSRTEQKSLAELFSQWVTDYRNRDCDKDIDYYLIKRMLIRWGDFQVNDALSRLNKEAIGLKLIMKDYGY